MGGQFPSPPSSIDEFRARNVNYKLSRANTRPSHRHALALVPHDVFARAQLGDCLREGGDARGALQAFRAARALYPAFPALRKVRQWIAAAEQQEQHASIAAAANQGQQQGCAPPCAGADGRARSA